MRQFFRRTRVRLTFVFTLLVFAVVSVSAAAFWTVNYRFEYDTVDETLRSQADVVRQIIAQTPATAGLPSMPAGNPRGVAMQTIVVDSGGRIVSRDQADADIGPLIAFGTRAGFPAHARLQSTTQRGVATRVLLRVVTLPDQTAGGLIIARPIDELQARLARVAFLLVAGDFGLVAVAAALTWRLAGLALAPVRRMSAAARRMSERDLHRRLESNLPASDELGELAMTFNAMLGRLETAFDTLQRFTADAAHELRAPLAVLQSQAEVTLRQPRMAEEYRRSQQAQLREIQRLSRVADQLLLLARADAGVLDGSVHDFDLPDLLEEAVSRWSSVAKERGVGLKKAIPSDGRVEADQDLVGRLLDNLLDNAIRHTPAGGQVRLDAACKDREWRILVSDSGPGISPEVRTRVFERFFRSDPVRARANGGAGLGLSLAKAIVEFHGGSIEVAEDGPLAGACFVVKIPARHR